MVRNLPSQKLQDMLHYIEKSRKENVTNQDIAELDELVQKVKQDREVGAAYMKSWERERMIREEGREEGKVEGREEGKIEGKIEGILELLEDIGPIPKELEETIREQKDLKTLQRCNKTAAKAESMEDFQKNM